MIVQGQYGPKRKCRTCHALREWKRRHPGSARTVPYSAYRRNS
jgi:hypothetical protein